MKKKNDVVAELFREILGTISVEEFTTNRKLGELTKNLFNELSAKAKGDKWD